MENYILLPNGQKLLKTTLYEDFMIANTFGVQAIRETFNSYFACNETNIDALAALAVACSVHCCQAYESGNTAYNETYYELYHKILDYVDGNPEIPEDERRRFWAILD